MDVRQDQEHFNVSSLISTRHFIGRNAFESVLSKRAPCLEAPATPPAAGETQFGCM